MDSILIRDEKKTKKLIKLKTTKKFLIKNNLLKNKNK
jgi:hypothetical protein